MTFTQEFTDVNTKVYYLNAANDIVEDTVIAVDYKKVIENKKSRESLRYVLASDIYKFVTDEFFCTSKEKLKKKLDSKFKVKT